MDKLKTHVSVSGEAIYPHLNKPDVKFVIYTLSHMEEEFDNLVIKNV